MTARPLDFTFAPMSDLSRRPPWSISVDEQEAELRDEILRRRDIYPVLVAKGRGMTQEDANRHIFILDEILADCTVVEDERPREIRLRLEDQARQRRIDSRLLWEDKVRELRRELQIRRNSYPGHIEKGRASAEDARERMERLEAVHWRYWMTGFTRDENFGDEAAVERYARWREFEIQRWAVLLDALDAGAPWAPRVTDKLADVLAKPGHWWSGWVDGMRADVAAWHARMEQAA